MEGVNVQLTDDTTRKIRRVFRSAKREREETRARLRKQREERGRSFPPRDVAWKIVTVRSLCTRARVSDVRKSVLKVRQCVRVD